MKSKIENIRLKFKCDVDWDEMSPTDSGRHCNNCNKTVYDFTDAKPKEFLQILAENNNNICGRFKPEQMAPTYIHVPVWKKWVSAAMVLIGINVLNNQTHAQGVPRKSVQHDFKVAGIVTDTALMPGAEFPGGDKVFAKFLRKNIQYPKGAINGRVYATFIVQKNGILRDIKILRKLNPVNDAEVIRVLKLSPKWIPAKHDGKPVDSRFTIPVNFSKPKPVLSSYHLRG